MKLQGLAQWSPCNCTALSQYLPLSLTLQHQALTFSSEFKPPGALVSSASKLNCLEKEERVLEREEEGELTARDRRRLRNERRQTSEGINWRERVEERLIKKPKKRYASWTEELNLDTLGILGPQWWVVRVSRVSGQDTADRLARLLSTSYPDVEFKLYNPGVEEKRKLKNGSYSVKAKPLFPGCVFLRCVLNKELHDFIREIDGVGGFIGSKVGNTKRQINKPRPVSEDDMEAIFKQAKQEQLKADQAFLEMERASDLAKMSKDAQSNKLGIAELQIESEPERRPRKASVSSVTKKGKRNLRSPGSAVKVTSGVFAGFPGILKKIDRKNGKAIVGFTLLGKETLADVDIEQIEVEDE